MNAGTLEYGQIQVGVLLPNSAVMLDNRASPATSTPTGTTNLQNKTQNPSPKGFVWLVGQDHRLVRQPIEILQRYENTGQVLVSGVALDSVVVLVPLSANDAGKVVTVK